MMKWIPPIRRKLGRHFGIPNLMFVIGGCQVIVFVFYTLFLQKNIDLIGLLSFDRELILQGQVWRLISYAIIPSTLSPMWLAVNIYFYCLIGYYLEREWDTLGMNLYFFIGIFLTSLAGMITGYAYTTYISLSLFLAFAILFPDFSFLIFFIVPVKAKYLAYLDWLLFVWALISEPLGGKIAAILALGNLFLFFGDDYYYKARDFFRRHKQRAAFREATKDLRDAGYDDPYGPNGPYN